MTTITIPGFIHAEPANSWDPSDRIHNGVVFNFWRFEKMEGEVLVCPHVITFDIPEGWDPIPGQVADLEREKARVTQEFTAKLAEINERLSKLLAIGHTEAA